MTARRFRRLFQAFAVHVVQPAVIEAAEAAVFEPAVGNVGAPVAPMAVEQSNAVLLVPKIHQLLAQEIDRRQIVIGNWFRSPKKPAAISADTARAVARRPASRRGRHRTGG